MKSVLDILRKIRPEGDFEQSKDYLAEGLLDSFDIVTLVVELDSVFGLSIPGADITPENFRNFIAIKALVERCQNQR